MHNGGAILARMARLCATCEITGEDTNRIHSLLFDSLNHAFGGKERAFPATHDRTAYLWAAEGLK